MISNWDTDETHISHRREEGGVSFTCRTAGWRYLSEPRPHQHMTRQAMGHREVGSTRSECKSHMDEPDTALRQGTPTKMALISSIGKTSAAIMMISGTFNSHLRHRLPKRVSTDIGTRTPNAAHYVLMARSDMM